MYGCWKNADARNEKVSNYSSKTFEEEKAMEEALYEPGRIKISWHDWHIASLMQIC